MSAFLEDLPKKQGFLVERRITPIALGKGGKCDGVESVASRAFRPGVIRSSRGRTRRPEAVEKMARSRGSENY